MLEDEELPRELLPDRPEIPWPTGLLLLKAVLLPGSAAQASVEVPRTIAIAAAKTRVLNMAS